MWFSGISALSLFCAFRLAADADAGAHRAGFGGAAPMSVNTALIRLIYPQRHLGRGMGINFYRRRLFRRGSDDRRGDFIHLIMEMAVSD